MANDAQIIEKLKAAGMVVNEVDAAPFAKMLEPLYAEYEKKVIGSELMNIYRQCSGF